MTRVDYERDHVSVEQAMAVVKLALPAGGDVSISQSIHSMAGPVRWSVRVTGLPVGIVGRINEAASA